LGEVVGSNPVALIIYSSKSKLIRIRSNNCFTQNSCKADFYSLTPNKKILLTYIYNLYMGELIEFTKELLHNQPNTVMGVGLAILFLLGIYIKLLDIYQ